jgi:AAA15 family ATPase/GTPase
VFLVFSLSNFISSKIQSNEQFIIPKISISIPINPKFGKEIKILPETQYFWSEYTFEGKIEQTGQNDQPFIFKKGNQQFVMQQTAEGIKKIGILTTLITNRQLGKGTILFMDEPETALHPDAVRQMVEMLVAMSKAGVQIFLASHSYFVIKQLANCAKRDQLNVSCWNLNREVGKPVSNSFYDLMNGVLPSNSIIDEAIKIYDEEINIDLK